MPPVFAVLLGFTSSLAILFAVALAFTDPESDSEPPPVADGTEEAAVRRAGPLEQAAYLGLLIVPVGLIPMTARRKGRNGTRWAAAGVGAGLVQLLAPIIFIHPLMPLLTLLFLRPGPLGGPAPPGGPLPGGESRPSDGGAAASAVALPASTEASGDIEREAPPARRRSGLRRRRASRGPRRRRPD